MILFLIYHPCRGRETSKSATGLSYSIVLTLQVQEPSKVYSYLLLTTSTPIIFSNQGNDHQVDILRNAWARAPFITWSPLTSQGHHKCAFFPRHQCQLRTCLQQTSQGSGYSFSPVPGYAIITVLFGEITSIYSMLLYTFTSVT